jgi:hypothetical protein
VWACPHITEILQLLAHVEDDRSVVVYDISILGDLAASALNFTDSATEAASFSKTLVTVHTKQDRLYPKSFVIVINTAVRPSGFQFPQMNLLQ